MSGLKKQWLLKYWTSGMLNDMAEIFQSNLISRDKLAVSHKPHSKGIGTVRAKEYQTALKKSNFKISTALRDGAFPSEITYFAMQEDMLLVGAAISDEIATEPTYAPLDKNFSVMSNSGEHCNHNMETRSEQSLQLELAYGHFIPLLNDMFHNQVTGPLLFLAQTKNEGEESDYFKNMWYKLRFAAIDPKVDENSPRNRNVPAVRKFFFRETMINVIVASLEMHNVVTRTAKLIPGLPKRTLWDDSTWQQRVIIEYDFY